MAPVATDRFSDALLKSVRKFLATQAGYTGVWILSPEFNHDVRPDGSPRTLPYIGIEQAEEETVPWEVGNKKVQRNVSFRLWVVCENHAQTLRRPQQVQQLFLTSEVDGIDGAIPLCDFDAVGSPQVGYVEIMTGLVRPVDLAQVPGLEFEEKRTWKNLRFVGVVDCRVEEERVKQASLLE